MSYVAGAIADSLIVLGAIGLPTRGEDGLYVVAAALSWMAVRCYRVTANWTDPGRLVPLNGLFLASIVAVGLPEQMSGCAQPACRPTTAGSRGKPVRR
jgi:hypothetical protein